MKVVIQSRVSTIIQENKRQVQELSEYASKMGWEVVKVFEEKISDSISTTDYYDNIDPVNAH